MDILEAYQRTLDAVNDLREAGVIVKIRASKSPKKQEDEDPLPRGKWVIIEFFLKNHEEAHTIRKKANELGWAGITFDTSGHLGQRQWEIDWSFRLGDTPDGEWEAAGDDLEKMIDKMEEGQESQKSDSESK